MGQTQSHTILGWVKRVPKSFLVGLSRASSISAAARCFWTQILPSCKALNQAVKRNVERFPGDFMFQLTESEAGSLRSQNVTLKNRRGQHRKYLPYVFTEQGVAMLSSVLRSRRAVLVNIEIMRAFLRLRTLLAAHADLAQKLDILERRYDKQFRVVFDAIRELMKPPSETGKRPIGFAPWPRKR